MTDADRKRRLRPPLVLAVLAVVALIGGAVFFFLKDDAPDAFDADDAASSLDDDTTGSTAFDGNIDGVWVVDPDLGEASGGTSAGFRVNEELSSIGTNTVVARTPGVTGTVVIEGNTITDVQVEIAMADLETDDSRRDGRMRKALDTDTFPTATFVLREPIQLDGVPGNEEPVTTTAIGDMTIKGTTKRVELAIDARLVDGVIVVVGSLDVVFADFGVETPKAPIVVSLDDHGIIEFQVFLTKR